VQATGHPLTPTKRVGQVISISASPTPTVEVAIGGDTSVTVFAPYADSYYPVVGDYVILFGNQGDWFVAGKPYTGTGRTGFLGSATNAGTVDVVTTNATVATVTVNVVNTRWYEINGYVLGSQVTNPGVILLKIVDGTTFGGTELTRLPPLQGGGQPTIAVGQGGAGVGSVLWQAPSTTSKNFSIAGQSSGGALRVTSGNGVIWIKDLGT